ncbi:hypothetical protein [Trinickia mobilis]|uniref:hypothetical protein n=1 Tax=Trinickia mobilis TaxID=2816356 RepID=UPI001A8E6F6F|nr:hypothetical protein [Trinickia mobilis]
MSVVRFGLREASGLPQQIRQIVMRRTVALIAFEHPATSALCARRVASPVGVERGLEKRMVRTFLVRFDK